MSCFWPEHVTWFEAKHNPLLAKQRKNISFENVFGSEGVSCELRMNYGVSISFFHTDEHLRLKNKYFGDNLDKRHGGYFCMEKEYR